MSAQAHRKRKGKHMDSITIDGQTFSIDDDLGYLQMMSSAFLGKIAEGKVDLQMLARQILASRGHDTSGKWVGFTKAAELHAASPAQAAASAPTVELRSWDRSDVKCHPHDWGRWYLASDVDALLARRK